MMLNTVALTVNLTPSFWENHTIYPSCSVALSCPLAYITAKGERERRVGIKLGNDGFYVSFLLMLWHTLISLLCVLDFCSQ